jgi:hypothetical protein
MEYSLDDLKRSAVSKLKTLAKEAGLKNYSKFNSADKAQLAKKIYRVYHPKSGESPRGNPTSRKSSRSPRKSPVKSPKKNSSGGCVSPHRCAVNTTFKKDHIEDVAKKCGISLTKSNGKAKTRKELCEEIAQKEGGGSPKKSPKKSPRKSPRKSPKQAKATDYSKEDLNKLTVAKLRDLCKSLKISPIPKKKSDLVDVILAKVGGVKSPPRKPKSPLRKPKSPPRKPKSPLRKPKSPQPKSSAYDGYTLTQLRKVAIGLGLDKKAAIAMKTKDEVNAYILKDEEDEEDEEDEQEDEDTGPTYEELAKMDQEELAEYVAETYGIAEYEGDDIDLMDEEQLIDVVRAMRGNAKPKSPSPRPKSPSPRPKSPSPKPKSPSPRPKSSASTATPPKSSSPEKPCAGFTFDELKEKSQDELLRILSGLGVVEGAPTSRGGKSQYICDISKYGQCGPDAPCGEGSVCDMSNDPGVCVSEETAMKRKNFASFIYKGRKIIGTSSAIDSLKLKLGLVEDGGDSDGSTPSPVAKPSAPKPSAPKPSAPKPSAPKPMPARKPSPKPVTPPRRMSKLSEGQEVPDPADILAEIQQGHGAADLGSMEELQTALFKCLGLQPTLR